MRRFSGDKPEKKRPTGRGTVGKPEKEQYGGSGLRYRDKSRDEKTERWKKDDSGEKPWKKRESSSEVRSGKPWKRTEGEDKPWREKKDLGARPWKDKKESGEKTWKSSHDDKPRRSRKESSDQPWTERRESEAKPWQERKDGGDRPWKGRREGGKETSSSGEKTWRGRREQEEKPWGENRDERKGKRASGEKPWRRSEASDDRPRRRSNGDEKPWTNKRESGEKPWGTKQDGTDKPWTRREDRREGDRSQDDRKSHNSWRDKERSDERPSRFRNDRDERSNERPSRFRNDRDDRSSRSEKPFSKGFFSSDKTRKPKKENYSSRKSDVADDGLIRLNKYIANSGISSRREADEMIAAGAIKVNGVIVTELGTKVSPGDKVQIGDETLNPQKKVYLLLNKPKGYITTVEDPQERNTVMMLVKDACRERIYPVGRLDRNTSGLLLMTNDGELAKKLTHPSHKVRKIYHVELNKSFSKSDMTRMTEGIELEDGIMAVDEIAYTGPGEDKKNLGVVIHSGKNRVVRRLFEALEYEVVKLDRVVFANLTKKDLPRGRWRFLEESEINMLMML